MRDLHGGVMGIDLFVGDGLQGHGEAFDSLPVRRVPIDRDVGLRGGNRSRNVLGLALAGFPRRASPPQAVTTSPSPRRTASRPLRNLTSTLLFGF